MDYKPLPIGVDIFEHLITQGYYFVDKTLLIKDLLDKKGSVNHSNAIGLSFREI